MVFAPTKREASMKEDVRGSSAELKPERRSLFEERVDWFRLSPEERQKTPYPSDVKSEKPKPSTGPAKAGWNYWYGPGGIFTNPFRRGK
jgi:hypothetical protein